MIQLLAALVLAFAPLAAQAGTAVPAPVETPYFAEKVAAGSLPPVTERLPRHPAIAPDDMGPQLPGKPGGVLRTLLAKAQDTRLVGVFGYTRLVGYDSKLNLVPDVLEKVDIEEGRVFTMHLRPGHRWSDGAPFTTEDFRYYWEDVATNKDLSPGGPPMMLRVDGELPKVTIIDETTVRYAWSNPNPGFLTALAGPSPLYIYRPSRYLRQFHAKYTPPGLLQQRIGEARQRNWGALHNRKDNMYRNDNPELPTLDPWVLANAPPAERFIFVRNPYYHRIDSKGQQLPYIDKLAVTIVASQLIPAKTGAGESDFQSRYLRFDNVTFLKASEARVGQKVLLWRNGKASQVALYPNLNCDDPVWRGLFRDVQFRRALSLGINRKEINQVVFYGLALPGNNDMLPQSPLYDQERRMRWATYDKARANRLLDEIGLKKGSDGLRILPDGRPATIVVETAGESTEETDVLQLVHDTWLELGIKIYPKPMQREVFRNRVFAGQTLISVWTGLENGLATPDMSPMEIAPTQQQQLQWPRWGQWEETGGRSGEKPDDPAAKELLKLYRAWRDSVSTEERRASWTRMLDIWSDQVFTFGLVGETLQPLVISSRLRNVPEEGVYNWDPGAALGIYRPDTFWLDQPPVAGGS
jgi:peptide/nickel transport system substrate-binding protein